MLLVYLPGKHHVSQHGRLDSYGTRSSYSDKFLLTEEGRSGYVNDCDDDDDYGDKYRHHFLLWSSYYMPTTVVCKMVRLRHVKPTNRS